jgi:hypothetical protein
LIEKIPIYIETLCEGLNQFQFKLDQFSTFFEIIPVNFGIEKFTLDYFAFNDYAKGLLYEILKKSNYNDELVFFFLTFSFFSRFILMSENSNILMAQNKKVIFHYLKKCTWKILKDLLF